MYPVFCSYRWDSVQDDPYFAAVAADFGLGVARPGLAVGEHDGQVEVLVAPDGRTAPMPKAAVHLGLKDTAILGLMDAVEEAIEDALSAEDDQAPLVARMESTLDLLERCYDQDENAEV